jgi:RNA polymerase sigma factor (sigma-70 family)
MLKRRAVVPTLSHEDLFIQRYDWLMNWALRLTEYDREQAEDLVHDAFVQFSLDRPELDSIQQNLEGYLYTMLRNMHVSQLRRAARQRAATLPSIEPSLTDYDFIGDGLVALERQAVQAQEELRRICQYACSRKDTSKAGSVLILRFFHGYYPAEIAQVMHGTRDAANKWLQIARSEVKLYLADRDALSFISHGAADDLPLSNAAQTTEEFVHELRAYIFRSHKDDCLSSEQLGSLYAAHGINAIDGHVLAHVVSCAKCVDEVNSVLGLPPLAERYPTKMIGPDTKKQGKGGGGKSGGSGGAGVNDFITRSRKRLKSVRDHRPQQLRVSVNGFILGSHDVSAELNKQTISVKGEEQVGFVEIFSEQDVRLLFASVEPPPGGPVERKKKVELSDGRTVELAVDFSESWPLVHVAYHDPTFLKEAVTQTTETEEEPTSTGEDTCAPSLATNERRRLRGLISLAMRSFTQPGVWLKPGVVTGIVAFTAVALFVALRTRTSTTTLSAVELLNRATAAEELVAAKTDLVLHRTINLEETMLVPGAIANGSTNKLPAHRKLEIWQSAAAGIKALRVYDDKGYLIAGEWTRPDGVRTIYHHRSRPQLLAKTVDQASAPFTLENIWQLEPLASEFKSLIGQDAVIQLEEKSSAYVVSYQGSETDAKRGVLFAALTISRDDLHAIEQTLRVRQSDGLHEYRFVEASFERHTPDTVAPRVFEPEPELTGDAARRGQEGAVNLAMSPHLPATASVPVVATPAFEVEVLGLLSQASADLGEQLDVTRTPEGLLHVQGIVETEKRKAEILRALVSVANNPAIRIDVSTAAEALALQSRQQKSSSDSVLLEQVEPEDNRVPVYAELHRFLAGKGVIDSQIDAEISRLSISVSAHSRQSLQHAWAIKRLAERFSAEELRTLDSEARAKWLALIRSHAAVIQRETAAIRQELQPIFGSAGPTSVDGTVIFDTGADAGLLQAVRRLFELCSANDQAIRAAFTIARDSSVSARMKSAQFWQALVSTETLAAKIRH